MKGALGSLVIAALFLTGCSGGAPEPTTLTGKTDSSETPKATPKKENLKIALLTPGPVNDAGWSAMAYDGLKFVQSQLGGEVQTAQAASEAQIRDAMRSYAQKGFDLVIGHGYEYNEPGVEVAKDFPNTFFVSSSGGKTAPNAGAFRFQLEEGFYLAGMTAGLMTKTGTVAMIGGPQVPSIVSTFKAFKAGAESTKPGIKVIETFTLSNDDIAKANQATLKAIEQGADLVIHQANAAAQGVFDACKAKKVWAFGANSNQNDNPSGVVLGSAVINAGPAFLALATKVKNGTYHGGIESMSMAGDAIDFVFNDRIEVPADVKTKIHAARADIKSGKLMVPMDKF